MRFQFHFPYPLDSNHSFISFLFCCPIPPPPQLPDSSRVSLDLCCFSLYKFYFFPLSCFFSDFLHSKSILPLSEFSTFSYILLFIFLFVLILIQGVISFLLPMSLITPQFPWILYKSLPCPFPSTSHLQFPSLVTLFHLLRTITHFLHCERMLRWHHQQHSLFYTTSLIAFV